MRAEVVGVIGKVVADLGEVQAANIGTRHNTDMVPKAEFLVAEHPLPDSFFRQQQHFAGMNVADKVAAVRHCSYDVGD